VFNSNLQTKKFWVPELKKFVKLKVTTRAIRSIDKIGLTAMLKAHGVSLKSLMA
jgi:large subunit ribosomal protein L28